MREEAELTQRDLAKTLKVAQQTVHSSETGSRRVDIAEFCRWAEACGVDATAAINRYLLARSR
jgi:transcriptional regulator with XRE-family HTH domain